MPMKFLALGERGYFGFGGGVPVKFYGRRDFLREGVRVLAMLLLAVELCSILDCTSKRHHLAEARSNQAGWREDSGSNRSTRLCLKRIGL